MLRILVLAAASACLSCVRIDGGAVEAAWVVRSADGLPSDCGCANPKIARIQLALVGVSAPVKDTQPCLGRDVCQFDCPVSRGATPFDIPPGSYLMSLVAVDAAGRDLSTPGLPGGGRITPPAPILREVVRGQPTQLDVAAIVTACSGCSANKTPGCSSP
jgi:hypothetical protein